MIKYNDKFYPCKGLYDKLAPVCLSPTQTVEEAALCESLKAKFEKCMKRQRQIRSTMDACTTMKLFETNYVDY